MLNMNSLKLYTIEIEGKTVGYWSNNIREPRKVFLLLSPGAYSGKFFTNFEKYFSKNDLLICPDYPARGFSEPQKDNSVEAIAKSVDKFLTTLSLNKNINLVAFSYGTQVATELIKINGRRFEKVILIASGEFFGILARICLRIMFGLLLVSKKSQHVIKKYVLRYLYVPSKNLNDINLQWLSTLNYKIPKTEKVDLPAILVDFAKDKFVTKRSKSKIRELFVNYKTLTVDGLHPSDISDYDKFFKNNWKLIYE